MHRGRRGGIKERSGQVKEGAVGPIPGKGLRPGPGRAGASSPQSRSKPHPSPLARSSWTSSWCGTGPHTWLTTGRPPPNTCGSTRAQPLRCWRSKCEGRGCGRRGGTPSPAPPGRLRGPGCGGQSPAAALRGPGAESRGRRQRAAARVALSGG